GPRIVVRTGVDVSLGTLAVHLAREAADVAVLTCPLDRFCAHRFGALDWRGIAVRCVHVPHVDYAQEATVVNYPGAAHLAAAVGAPAVVCFLSGDPLRWSHRGHRVARAEVGCNPCSHLDCPIDHRCARRLDTHRVIALARSVLCQGTIA
ncbi:MAG: hypothetical protein KY463_15525, partial [Actinobacteria bacterium]|nr:hypothetical protein [Actinomycetota bacterium]